MSLSSPLLTVVFSLPAETPSLEAIFQRIRPAVVGLKCKGPRGEYFGTGALIHVDGYLLSSTTVLPLSAPARMTASRH